MLQFVNEFDNEKLIMNFDNIITCDLWFQIGRFLYNIILYDTKIDVNIMKEVQSK